MDGKLEDESPDVSLNQGKNKRDNNRDTNLKTVDRILGARSKMSKLHQPKIILEFDI